MAYIQVSGPGATGTSGDDYFDIVSGNSAVLTGGGGQDTFRFGTSGWWARITDFDAGDGGDRLDLVTFLRGNTQWDGNGNPFVLGFVTLAQTAEGTVLRLDRDGGADALVHLMTLSGVIASELTADNFLGTAPILDFAGTAAADALTGSATMDVFTLGAGDDQVSGGRGADTSVYSGQMAGYTTWFDGADWHVVDTDPGDGDDGHDVLREIETVRFADGEWRFNPAPRHGENIELSGTYSSGGRATAVPSGGFVLTWNASDNMSTTPYLRFYDSTGTPTGEAVRLDDGPMTYSPEVFFLADGSMIVTAVRSGYLQARMLSPSGTPAGEWFALSSNPPSANGSVDFALLSDGGFVMTWSSENSAREVYARRFKSTGVPLGDEFLVSTDGGAAVHAAVEATANGGFVIVWTDDEMVLARAYGADGSALNADPRVISDSADKYNLDVAALPNGDLIVVWASQEPVGGGWFLSHGLFATRLDQSGNPVGEPFRVSSSRSVLFPSIAVAPDGSFIVAWESSAAFGRSTLAQRFDADGDPLGGEFEISSSDAQSSPSLAALSDGHFVALWQYGDYSGEYQSFRVGSLFDAPGLDIVRRGQAHDEIIDGDVGNDELHGGGGLDQLRGAGGDDRLDGGSGADLLQGGLGADVYFVDDVGDVVIELAGQGSDRVVASVSFALGANVDVELIETASLAGTTAIDLTGSDTSNTIYGNNGVNTLTGNGGADTLFGFSGNDYLVGGAGLDNLYGGIGDDRFYIGFADGDRIWEFGGEGYDTVATEADYELPDVSDVERLEAGTLIATSGLYLGGSNLANLIIGNMGDNRLRGFAGNDTLDGLGGDDYLIGDEGADVMYGGTGNDTYYVNTSDDRIFENAGEGTNDRVATEVSFTLPDEAEVEVLEAANLTGTSVGELGGSRYANTITGDAGNNVLRGYGGNDTLTGYVGNDVLDGGTGADTMDGGLGNDRYLVDNAADVVIDQGGTPGVDNLDRVTASVSYTLPAGAQIEYLELISISATDALNLTGNEWSNALTGNNGSNVLDGRFGTDVLAGLGGADTFQFTVAPGLNNVDRIEDFVSGTDRIALDDAVFAGLGLGALSAAAFRAGSAAQDADDRILYDQATGALYFDADGNGAGTAVQFATLAGAPIVQANDFTVI